jgi:hypothetical protein
MADVFTAIKEGARATWCEMITRDNFGYDLFRGIPGLGEVVAPLDPVRALGGAMEAAVCNRPPQIPATQFTGCDNVSGATHKLTIPLGVNFNGCVTEPFELYGNGPFSLTVQAPGNDPCGWGFYSFTGPGSIIAFRRNGGAITAGNPVDGQTKGPGSGVAGKCGEASPPAPGSNQADSTQDINGTDVPISYVYGPAYQDRDGNLRAPFTADFTLGGVNVTFNGNLNFSTGDVVVGGSGGPTDKSPNDVVSDGAPSDPTNSTPDDDKTATDGIIRGAIVTITSDPTNVGILANDPLPSFYIPRMGRISFLVKTENGDSAWTSPVDIRLRREYFECPAAQGAIDVRAHFISGITGDVTATRSRPDQVEIVEN